MRKNLFFLFLFVFLASALFAAEHRISILGTGSSFYRPPLKKPADVQKMVTAKKADMQMILEKRGWTGNMDDLVNAVAAGKITETKIERGANLPFMAMRHGGKSSYMENVVWMGRKAFEAYLVEFDSNGYSYRLYIPKACANFWIEGKPSSSSPTQPVEDKPSVRLDVPEACVTQAPTVRVMVGNAPAGSNVQLSLDGQNVMTFAAANGTTEKQLTAYPEAGSHSISVTLDGAEAPATASLTVKACPPSCSLAALPPTVKRRAPVSIDVSGSQVASGVSVGMKSVSVEVLKDQTVVDSFDLTAPDLKRDDYKFKKSGMYTVRATATDNAGQKSTNTCEAQVEVPKQPLFFVAGFAGKERLVRDEFAGGRCAPLIGFKGGIIPEIGENLELELSIGGKINTRDTDNSSVFADVALNGVMDRWFIGGGVSFWDLTISDTRAVAALVQTGVNLDQNGRFQFVVEGRAPFNQFDDISNNYQVWAGIRFRPGR
jgi:hypothetical protein